MSYLRRSPIRIMHVIDKLSVSGSGVHGITKAIERWIPLFDANQFQFCVCSLRTPEKAKEIFEAQNTPVFFLGKGKFDPATLTSLLRLCKQEKIDILHLHGYGATNFGRLVTLFTGIPNVVHEHAVLPDQPLYQTIADTFLSALTTRAVAVSKPVEKFMVDSRRIQPSKIETIIIGLPISRLKEPSQKQICEARRELNIPEYAKVVSIVGRLDTQKGQVYLLKSARAILNEHPNTHFLIIGDGPDMSMLKSLAESEGISERINFTGFRKDVSVLLGLTDVVAMPSLWEGFPLSLLEAMNMRKPVVGTPAAGIADAIKNGETGFLVPFRNSELLGEKIAYLLKHDEVAQAMGDEAWNSCQQYDISKSARRLELIYTEILQLGSGDKSEKRRILTSESVGCAGGEQT